MKQLENIFNRLFKSNSLPIVLQQEGAECGLSCMAMISGYYGNHVTMRELRNSFKISMNGTDVSYLMQIGDFLNLKCRPLKVELDELPKIKLPAILHWNNNHYVVLESIKNNIFNIYDPSFGIRNIKLNEISASFTGIAVEFTPTTNFKKKPKNGELKLADVLRSTTGLGNFLWQLILLAFVIQVFSTLSPILNQMIMDEAIAKGDQDFLKTISLGVVFLAFINISVGLLQKFVGLYLGTQLSFQLQSSLLDKAFKLPASWFERRHLGSIMAIFSAISPVQDFISNAPVVVPLSIIMFLTSGVMILLYSPLLSVFVIISVVIPLIIRFFTFTLIKNKISQGVNLGANASTILMETLRSMRTFKLFVKENERLLHWQNEQIVAINNKTTLAKYEIFGSFGLELIMSIQSAFLWFVGASMVIKGEISLGMLMAFQSFSTQFTGSVYSLISAYFQWKTLEIYLDQVGSMVLEMPEKGIERPVNINVSCHGKIDVDSVSFAYSSNDGLVLKNANLSIEPGQFVSIVGPSGGGKSTLIKLIMGLVFPTTGRVLVDGIDIGSFGLRNYRCKCATVMQDDKLFQGSIFENVTFFDSNPKYKEVEDALKNASIYNDVMKMPMGLDTKIGDLGNTLSGGQQQRILLARALYRKPVILFLDEATSQLEPTKELEIFNNLRKLNITIVSIAHRPTAIQGADRYFAVENGHVRELKQS